MRCLYCGKELALLKRWTGGGEFCSDAHRQQYQEEYNQLALNRLLQAKPRGESKPAEEPKAPVEAKVPATASAVVEPEPAPAAFRSEEPVFETREPEPVSVNSRDESGPAASAGFLMEVPTPVMAQVLPMAKPETGLEHLAGPSFPRGSFESGSPHLATAGRIALEPSGSVLDYATQRGERGLEIREFARSARVIGFDFLLGGKPELGSVDEPLPVLVSPSSPTSSPNVWQEPAVEFRAIGIELGAWAQLAFRTTGIRDNEEEEERAAPPSHAEPPPDVLQAAPEREASETAPASTPGQQHEPTPELVSKPMPLTLHGIAAGKGKPVQVFTTAGPGGIEVQVPRSQALPLRPLMIFGPPPKVAEKKRLDRSVVVKTEPKKPVPVPEAPPVPVKARKPELRSPEAPALATPAKPKDAARESSRAAPVSEPASPPLPAPENAIDLGLPTLSLAASGSFWSRIPLLAKIGGAVGLLAIAGVVALVVRGAGNTAASSSGAGVMEGGPPLAIADSGWITDWGKEPGAHQDRQLLVLRSSLNLTNYRMEFQGQIETKGLGWLFRAKDPKNCYVTKLEVLKPGINPTVALVRFPVINGEEQQRTEVPLPMPVRPDTLYKIRFEAVGNRFTTWVLDHKLDEWTDNRIASGGVGLYNERGELASLKGGVRVVPLVVKK